MLIGNVELHSRALMVVTGEKLPSFVRRQRASVVYKLTNSPRLSLLLPVSAVLLEGGNIGRNSALVFI